MASQAQVTSAQIVTRTSLAKLTSFVVYLFERVMPDPFVFAVILTLLAAFLAKVLVRGTTYAQISGAWYGGIFSIFTFAFQMVLIVVTGYSLASSPLVHSWLTKAAALAKSPRGAISLTVLVAMCASWLNWGFGLVASALFAREIAKRVRVDFGWLVAAAYTGFVVSTEGLSGSIALSQATPGSALNLVEKAVGHTIPLRDTLFARFTLLPELVLIIALPVIYRFLEPAVVQSAFADPATLSAEDQGAANVEKRGSLGVTLDNAWVLNISLAAACLMALAYQWRTKGFSIELNSVIVICLLLGLLCHWRPIAYVNAVRNAARVTGPLILQYPFYGGIMGIMTATGLGGVISKWFLAFSTGRTLPFWTYVSSLTITLFIPSGGGHWAVQGPFILPAAQALHSSLAGTTMAVAMGESVANMLQPFFALPLLAIAGIPMRRMMGFMVITFVVSLLTFAFSMLLLLPAQ